MRIKIYRYLYYYVINFYPDPRTYASISSMHKKFVTIWPVTREGGSFIKSVTNGDKGGREGKKWPF